MNNDDFMRFMASWALVHETADEGWKAAVARGSGPGAGAAGAGPEAFVDGLSAMIAERKEQLKAELARGDVPGTGSRGDVAEQLDGVRFEVAELRGRLETLQASVDTLLARTDPGAE